jgi:hypothetical protein
MAEVIAAVQSGDRLPLTPPPWCSWHTGATARAARGRSHGAVASREKRAPVRRHSFPCKAPLFVQSRSSGLLRQPGDFEGIVPGPKELPPCDPAVLDPEDVPGAGLGLHAAALAASGAKPPDEDSATTPFRDLLDVEMEAFPDLEPRFPPLPDPRPPAIEPSNSRKPLGVIPFDIRTNASYEGVEVAPVKASTACRAISTFSCDITYSRIPAASRVSARLRKSSERRIFPSRKVTSWPNSWPASMPAIRAVTR